MPCSEGVRLGRQPEASLPTHLDAVGVDLLLEVAGLGDIVALGGDGHVEGLRLRLGLVDRRKEVNREERGRRRPLATTERSSSPPGRLREPIWLSNLNGGGLPAMRQRMMIGTSARSA